MAPLPQFLRCLVDGADPPEWVGLSWAVDPGHLYTLHLRQGPVVSREVARSRGRELIRNGIRLLIEEGKERLFELPTTDLPTPVRGNQPEPQLATPTLTGGTP